MKRANQYQRGRLRPLPAKIDDPANRGPLAPFVVSGGSHDQEAEKPKTGTATLIVFGLDQSGKPHASRFEQADAELAKKAAGLMGMRALVVDRDELQEIAAKLPQGRVFASGRGFVPFVRAALYQRLAALAEPVGADRPGRQGVARPKRSKPASGLASVRRDRIR